MGSGCSTSGHGEKLDLSQFDEPSLAKMLDYIKSIVTEYPVQSEVQFKKSFKWVTSVSFATFHTALQSPSQYITSDSDIASVSKTEDGNPVATITKSDDNGTDIEVWSLKYLNEIINCTGHDRLNETKLCLKANTDPITYMLGPAFTDTSIDSLLQLRQRLTSNDANDSMMERFKLSLLINNITQDMLTSIAKQDGKIVALSPLVVNQEMELLQSQTDESVLSTSCLKSIQYSSELVFPNGCHCPPWYQLHGDFDYINIDLLDDADPICVTANVEGYYVNKGFASNNVRPETEGQPYSTLSDLLDTKSEKFTANFKKEVNVSFRDSDHDDNEYIVTPGNNKRNTILMMNSGRDQLNGLATKNRRSKVSVTPHSDYKKKSASSMRSNHDISEFGDDSDSSESGSEEEDISDRRPESTADLPSEYWQIQKLIKYLKGGNQTATVISLCLLLDFDLSQESSHLAVRDNGGLDTLINLLETEDIKCKIGTLRILKIISTNTQTRTAIVDLKGLPQLVSILQSDNRELKCLAAETIANIAKFRRGRRIVRSQGGLNYLVNMLETPGRPGSPISGERSDIEVSRCAAQGLWSCSRSRKNKMALLKTNVVPLLGKLLQSNEESILIPVVGTLQECASESMYQAIIRSEGMVEHLVKGLHLDSTELKMHCAAAIFKCAEDNSTRELVYKFKGIESLAKLLSNTDNKQLLTAATGAIWKCSKSPAIVQQLKQLKAVEKLVGLITNQPEEVQINVVGAIGECAAQDKDNRVIIRKAGGVTPLVQLLTGTNQPLLINTTKAVGACALDNDSMMTIDRQDGVRLLWSLLKSPNPEVQACAAWAICPCIQNAKDAGELVRSFVGGLELIVGLLKSEDVEVLASVCAAIAMIAQDQENLAVITDHGVVIMLSRLTGTTNDQLRHHLADAIARCCSWRNNRIGFGQNNAVAPLVEYLKSPDQLVHQTTACALHQLSKDPDNCITMHEAGVVKLLLPMVGSKDEILQEAAAGCINNIRHLALANEKLKHR